MSTRRRFLVGPITLLMFLAACATPGGQDGPASSTAIDDTTSSPGDGGDAGMPDRPATIPDEIWQTIVDEVAEVASSENVPTVVTAEPVTWSDGSLGCPQPDMGYTQALVPGYRVVIEVGDEEIHFHASDSGTVIRCDNPQPPAEGGSSDR